MTAPASAAPMATALVGVGEVPRLAAAFEHASLTKGEWTHRAHLLVGLWYATRLPEPEAIAAMRGGIQRLNAVHGVTTTPAGGYHETITRAYMRLIGRFAAEEGGSGDWAARASRLLDRHGERDHLLRYYSRDRLMSVEARFGWVEPDLTPLPGLESGRSR